MGAWDELTISDLYNKIVDVQDEIQKVVMKFTRETGVWLKVEVDNFRDYEPDESTDECRVVAEGYKARATPTNL
jgi:hypothetical protein